MLTLLADTLNINGIETAELVGEIYGLCKDQNGCRFLQRKIEEGKASDIQLIFDEVLPHIVELMIGKLGFRFLGGHT